MKLALLFVLSVIVSSSSIENAVELTESSITFELPLGDTLWLKKHASGTSYRVSPASSSGNKLHVTNELGLLIESYQYFELTCNNGCSVNDMYFFTLSEVPKNNQDGHIFIPPQTSMHLVKIV